MIRTYSAGEVTEIVGAPSEPWLIQQLRAGRFPGRKVGRHRRMTEPDIADALDVCATDSRISSTGPRGLTSRSRKGVAG